MHASNALIITLEHKGVRRVSVFGWLRSRRRRYTAFAPASDDVIKESFMGHKAPPPSARH